MKSVELFTDGACSGNPGPGGWAVILKYNNRKKELFGAEKLTTNNRMEMIAVIKGLEALKEECYVDIYSDSKYVCDAISKGWAKSWKLNNWKKKDKKTALNFELWEKLLDLSDKHQIHIHWIKGHAGHFENERCDELAVKAIKSLLI